MRALGRVLAVLSCLVLAAHFLRAAFLARAVGSSGAPLLFLLLLVSLALPLLMLVRGAWGETLLRVALLVATLEWVRYLWEMAARRRAAGEPWLRAVAILSSVAVVTALAALLVRGRGSARPSG